jgi:putative spermidine/putrescine transport system ATP-binding protein
VALLGPSGCGKTTALRVLAGLERVNAGQITVDGVDVVDVPTNKRDIGMVFQAYSLFPHLSVLENVEFGLRMRRVPPVVRATRAQEALEMVGLGEHAELFAHQLSGGQQQRVALARALVTRPRMLLLDEPLSALDAQVRVQLRDEIRRIQTELGITTVFVTHDQEEALAVADRVAVMREGRIEQIGTPEELYLSPANSFVAGFIGLSNQLPANIVNGVLELCGTSVPMLGELTADGPVTAFVRPENLVLSAGAGAGTGATAGAAAGATASAGASAVVLSSSFLGSLRRTVVRLTGSAASDKTASDNAASDNAASDNAASDNAASDSTVLTVQHEASFSVSVGETVWVSFVSTPVLVTTRLP